jgi:cytochrome c553
LRRGVGFATAATCFSCHRSQGASRANEYPINIIAIQIAF